jgi:ubiquinone/menaquinone biosynthesis C-methylase UbiE
MINFINEIPLVSVLLIKLTEWRIKEKILRIKKTCDTTNNILDVGSGNSVIAKGLIEDGYRITLLDIKNKSFFKDFGPILYNGERIPFAENQFDVALLITVLHHTPDPVVLIKEVSRVSKKIVIIEEVYSNMFQKKLTFFIDSLFNLQFTNHPHSNKKDREWRKIFKELKLEVLYEEYWKSFFFLKRVLYCLKT